ncbi:MAG: hypothetical protein ACXVCP_06630 [Bdellovibrio sp.]
MNRRLFLSSMVLAGTVLRFPFQSQEAFAAEPDSCTPGLDFVSAEATYFSRYEHFHLLSIPVSILIKLPKEGYTTRTTTLDQGSLDEEAFAQFIKETGLNGPALKKHSHEVHFTFEDLQRIASGEQNVEVIVKSPKGNLAHKFYFTASRSALVKIRRGK